MVVLRLRPEERLPLGSRKGIENKVENCQLIEHSNNMKSTRYVYWQDGNMWLGYLEEYPDCQTQGETFEELQYNLKDLYADLTGGAIPIVKHVGELQLA